LYSDQGEVYQSSQLEQFMREMIVILICVHILADFLLQPGWMIRMKKQWHGLVIHAAIHAIAAYAVIQTWRLWYLFLVLMVSHILIDFIKLRLKDTPFVFVVDQIFHIGVILTIGWLISRSYSYSSLPVLFYKGVVLFSGYIGTIQGAGFFIDTVARQIIRENNLQIDGLKNGSKIIGQLERTLIFLFILIEQPAGIGFLVAAKSVLRFEEAKKQEHAEYILIGTLLSFSLAIAFAYVTRWVIYH
jgi:hypothetical protein